MGIGKNTHGRDSKGQAVLDVYGILHR